MKVTSKDAPASLNLNDKAFWVLGYNAAIDAASLTALSMNAEEAAKKPDVQSFHADSYIAGYRDACVDIHEKIK